MGTPYIHYITVVPIKKINPMGHLCRRRGENGNNVIKIKCRKLGFFEKYEKASSFLLFVILHFCVMVR